MSNHRLELVISYFNLASYVVMILNLINIYMKLVDKPTFRWASTDAFQFDAPILICNSITFHFISTQPQEGLAVSISSLHRYYSDIIVSPDQHINLLQIKVHQIGVTL